MRITSLKRTSLHVRICEATDVQLAEVCDVFGSSHVDWFFKCRSELITAAVKSLPTVALCSLRLPEAEVSTRFMIRFDQTPKHTTKLVIELSIE